MRKNRIKELRKAQKITLKELSEKLKEKGLTFTDSQLSKFENGTSTPRNEDIWEALAEIFDVSLAYVMGIEMGLVNIYPPTLINSWREFFRNQDL